MPSWDTTGNTIGANDFLGGRSVQFTEIAQPLVIRTNGIEAVRIDPAALEPFVVPGDVSFSSVARFTNGITISANSRAGIGTMSPDTTLHVLGPGGGAVVATFEQPPGAMNFVDLKSTQGGGNYGTDLRFIDSGTVNAEIKSTADGQLRFATNGTERLTIDSNGNVSIGNVASLGGLLPGQCNHGAPPGTLLPTAKLTVVETEPSANGTAVHGAAIGGARFSAGVRGESDEGHGVIGVSENAIGVEGCSERETGVYGSGVVGVSGLNRAAAAPGSLVSPNGGEGVFGAGNPGVHGFGFNGGLAGRFVGNVEVTGIVTAVNFVPTSSREIKDNIVDLCSQEALEALEHLSPVKFNYKGEAAKNVHIGFIAEDAPESVVSSDRKGVSLMDIIAILTQVVKEQQKTIKALMERSHRLESLVTER